MSQLFRKEAMEHRSRALFGEVVLRGPLSRLTLAVIILMSSAIIAGILFGIDVGGQSVWSWLT